MSRISDRQRAALAEAATWHTQLHGGEPSPKAQADHSHWLQQDPLNQWAWQQLEGLQQRLFQLPRTLAGRTLDLAAAEQRNSRRSVLKGMALLVGGGAFGWQGYHQLQEGPWLADYRTAVGQRLPVILADGGQMLLNTDSAADVRYSVSDRRIRLRQGEVMISTAADPAGRPFWVQTLHGQMQALGTRFSVRVTEASTQVSVYQHQVRITPGRGEPVLLQAGETTHFSVYGVAQVMVNDPTRQTWTQGVLVANELRLGDLIEELARYRPGWLDCDPALAGLPISGTFPLDDTDKALLAVASALPVDIQRRTRYWVKVTAR